jgi:hypothetical protein
MDTFVRWSMSAILVPTSLIRAFRPILTAEKGVRTRRDQEASRLNAKTSCLYIGNGNG